MWYWLLFLSFAWAELGLTIVSSKNNLNGAVIRVKDGRLVAGADGSYPILQVNFEGDSLILSHKLIAESAVGAGIGLAADSRMGVFAAPAHGFSMDDGWLEFNGDRLFVLSNDDKGNTALYQDWRLLGVDGEPVMVHLAELVYSGEATTAPVTSTSSTTLPPELPTDQPTQEPTPEVPNYAPPFPTTTFSPPPIVTPKVHERPTSYTTVFSTVYMPRTTSVPPVTSTVSLFQEVFIVTTTRTITAWPTGDSGYYLSV